MLLALAAGCGADPDPRIDEGPSGEPPGFVTAMDGGLSWLDGTNAEFGFDVAVVTQIVGEESVTISRGDDCGGADNGFTYFVEVRWWSGASCSSWSLSFEGRAC